MNSLFVCFFFCKLVKKTAAASWSTCIKSPNPVCPALQLRENEELCTAQQNSLEECEERFRGMQDARDDLQHRSIALKAAVLNATKEASEARAAQEELLAELASSEQQALGLQAEVDERDARIAGLEAQQVGRY